MGTLKKAVRAREALGQLRFVLPPTKTRTTCLVRHQDAKLAPPSDLRGGQLEVTCLIGNNRLFKPLRKSLGEAVHLLSRPRSNTVLYAVPTSSPGKAGRPRKYGPRLGNAADLAALMRPQALLYTLHVYGALREILAAEQVVMLRTLRCPVRVVLLCRAVENRGRVPRDQTGDRQQRHADAQSRCGQQSCFLVHSDVNPYLAQAADVLPYTVIGFVGSRFFVLPRHTA